MMRRAPGLRRAEQQGSGVFEASFFALLYAPPLLASFIFYVLLFFPPLSLHARPAFLRLSSTLDARRFGAVPGWSGGENKL